MIKKFELKNDLQRGFTLIELMVTMVIFVFVIAASSSVFTGLLTQFKQQSKIAEMNTEKTVGLEILRQDFDAAGYGLPWTVNGGWTVLNNNNNYNEADATVDGGGVVDPPNRAIFNDGSPVGTVGVIGAPRAIASGNNNGFRGSDYLVIKSTIVAENNASQKWTLISLDPLLGTEKKVSWIPATANLAATDYIITITTKPDSTYRSLVLNGTAFSTQNSNSTNFKPDSPNLRSVIYGIGPNNPRVPFNRADYYIENPNVLPLRCATSNLPLANRRTGVLIKSILNNSAAGGGTFATFQPLIDCVADMQIVYGFDMDGDGTIGTYSNADGSTMNTAEGTTMAEVQKTLGAVIDLPDGRDIASLLRNRLKEVRIYVLAQEGQMDTTYTYIPPVAPTFVPVGRVMIGGVSVLLGRDYDLTPIPNWQNYRWKVYTLVVNPKNLGVQ